ncbi:MAG: class I SAM-dependent methyltransferase [Gammaproteobacteria bacterium]|jgi:ubiquinone/menaquinone biosynthesis C-methylase UbiE
MNKQTHWETVYRERAVDMLSWFQATPAVSLALIDAARQPKAAPIIDMGGGASKLAYLLKGKGYRDITVVDIAAGALQKSRDQMGPAAKGITWIQGDATKLDLPKAYRIWHDRAVFHFLTDPSDRQAYLDRLDRYLEPGGQVILATFALDGPEKCSGLPVQRYSPETLAETLDGSFRLLDFVEETHQTPACAEQAFIYCRFERKTN